MDDRTNHVPFNWPYMTGDELHNIEEARNNGKLAGDGPFTVACHEWLEANTKSLKVLLTHSCTASLEMAALLLDIKPGDEIIMPSYTFVSTANAFVLRGATPVFIDIREDTLNINENLIENAITNRTRAIVLVHYAGVACEMDVILDLARIYGLAVVEDAAQGVLASYKGKPLGSIGDIGAYSFHETKNIISGEGGALLLNKSKFIKSAEIIREKGTDRSQFHRGIVDKYTWQSIGSSYLPGEITAAFLLAQLRKSEWITKCRINSWDYYNEILNPLINKWSMLRGPVVPDCCEHNAHMFYVILPPNINRREILENMKLNGVDALSHYIPLHSSPGGLKYGRPSGILSVTNAVSERIIRLPLWLGITLIQQNKVIKALGDALGNSGSVK